MPDKREHWSGNLGFIFAASGALIGLGNFWKFPYVAGQNGGGIFVLIYLICVIFMGLPLMLCAMTLGRASQQSPVGAFEKVSNKNSFISNLIGIDLILAGIALLCLKQYGWSIILSMVGILIIYHGWTIVGILAAITAFFILSYYSVVGGWSLGYVYKSFAMELQVDKLKDATNIFNLFIRNKILVLTCFAGFIGICSLIVLGGIKNGIERWSKILVPLLFACLLIVMLRSLTLPNAIGGIEFFLKPEFKRVSTQCVLAALGQSFYTLTLGMGITITYSSYISRQQNIFLSTLAVVALDTVVSIFVGLAVFPALFAMNFPPEHGRDLIFSIFPAVFNSYPLSWLWSGLFFTALAIAALTSGIALLEVLVSHFIDRRKMTRKKAVLICASGVFFIGLLPALSIAGWDKIKWIQYWLVSAFDIKSGSYIETIDYLSSHWFLPLCCLGISIFVGWVWGTHKAVQEIRHGSNNFADVNLIALMAGLKDDFSHSDERYHILTLASVWGIFIRFIAPVVITIAFIWMNVR